MANKTSSKRSLTVKEVIDLVESIDTPVLRIEKELGIPPSVLQRALRPDTQKPLPVKYEKPLLDYVSKNKSELKSIELKKEVVLATTGIEDYKPEITASEEEMENKNKWLDDLREKIPVARMISAFSGK